MGTSIDHRRLEFLRHVQHGVLSRRQLLDAGLAEHDLRRMLRGRPLRMVHRGVYVDHTGPLTHRQREWVAVLACWPAALDRESAIPGVRAPVIRVAIGRGRTVQPPDGVDLLRTAHLSERTDWRAAPPRVRAEHAVIDVMAERIAGDDIAGAFGVLAQACHAATTPDRITAALAARERVGGRRVIEQLVADRRTGACSVLERGYLQRVERAHGLPRADRQRPSRASGRPTAQDVRYERYRLVVELDGRAVHDSVEAWDDDARRDLAELAVTDAVTARVTHGLVFREPCATAGWVATLLHKGGWTGQIRRCPRCPAA